jgi:predicted transcriptional regulator
MAQTSEQKQLGVLEQIKRLIILSLSQQGVEGKRIAQVLGVDGATVSRILITDQGKEVNPR